MPAGKSQAAAIAGVLAPGAGLAVGTAAAMMLGMTGLGAMAVICAGFGLGFLAYKTLT